MLFWATWPFRCQEVASIMTKIKCYHTYSFLCCIVTLSCTCLTHFQITSPTKKTNSRVSIYIHGQAPFPTAATTQFQYHFSCHTIAAAWTSASSDFIYSINGYIGIDLNFIILFHYGVTYLPKYTIRNKAQRAPLTPLILFLIKRKNSTPTCHAAALRSVQDLLRACAHPSLQMAPTNS